MNTTTTTAAAEAAQNIEIYNELATVARDVFNHLNAEEGRIYTPAEIARAIVGGPVVTCVNGLNYRCDRVEKYAIGDGLTWCEGYNPDTVYEISAGGFSCRVNGWKIWDVMERAARFMEIPTAQRATFEKKRAFAPWAVSFTLSAAAARELAACCANDVLRPVMNGVHLDTRHRVLVATDGYKMRVFQLGDALTVDETTAAESYIIPADVIKSGRVVTIDVNGVASTDKKSAPCIAGRFPNWAIVIPAANNAGRIELSGDQWKQLKKAVADVAKVHPSGKYAQRRVILAHEELSDKLHVYAFNYDFNLERDNVVSIDNHAPAFSMSFDADQFAKIAGTPTALYIKDMSRAIVATDANGLTLVMPKQQLDDDRYFIPFSFADGAADLLPGLNINAAADYIKERNETAAAVEIVAKVREECKGKTTAKVLKHLNDNYGWSSVLERARQMLRDEIEAEKNAAAPAADETPAPADVFEAVDVPTSAAPADDHHDTAAENERESANETPAALSLTLPPLAELMTAQNGAPLLTLPTPAPVLLLPVLTSNDTPAPADARDIETAAAIVAALVPVAFVDVCETPANDGTTPGHGAAPVDTSAPLQIWHPATAAPAAARDIERETPANDDTRAALVYLAGRARRLALTVAAAVAAVFLLIFAPENETPATAAPVIETAPALVPDARDIERETPANDDTPAPVFEAVDTLTSAAPVITPPTMEKRATAKKRQPRARCHRDTATAAPVIKTAPALVPDVADIETPANDDTPAQVAPVAPDSVPALAPATAAARDTLETIGEITAPTDTATAAAPSLETAGEITAAPADDDTQTDTDGDTVPATSSPATSTGTTAPAAVGSAAAAGAISPAVLALLIYIL